MFAYRLRDSLVLGVKWKQFYTKAVSTEKNKQTNRAGATSEAADDMEARHAVDPLPGALIGRGGGMTSPAANQRRGSGGGSFGGVLAADRVRANCGLVVLPVRRS